MPSPILGALATKLAAAGLATATATTGVMAATDNLPGPAQQAVADAAERVGIDLPAPDRIADAQSDLIVLEPAGPGARGADAGAADNRVIAPQPIGGAEDDQDPDETTEDGGERSATADAVAAVHESVPPSERDREFGQAVAAAARAANAARRAGRDDRDDVEVDDEVAADESADTPTDEQPADATPDDDAPDERSRGAEQRSSTADAVQAVHASTPPQERGEGYGQRVAAAAHEANEARREARTEQRPAPADRGQRPAPADPEQRGNGGGNSGSSGGNGSNGKGNGR